jgi:CheY-like chemotaxis protein
VLSAVARTILVVEDVADVREYFAAALRDAGYRVLDVESVHDGLALLRAGRSIHAILADYNLVDGTGAELIHQAWNEGLFDPARQPAVICTAYKYVELPPHVVILHKPIDPAELLRALETAFASDCCVA